MFDYERMLDAILPNLSGVSENFNSKDKKNYSFKCTHHQDKTASAYIALKSDGGLVAGCRTCGSSYGLNQLLTDLGLNKMDFIEKNEAYFTRENLITYIRDNNIGNHMIDENTKQFVIDTDYRFENAYFYTDDFGKLVTVKIKYRLINDVPGRKTKKFAQRVIEDNKIVSFKTKSVQELSRQYIYNAVAVRCAIRDKKYVYLVEGEKDADTLIYNGLVATTFADGAGSMYYEYKEQLHNAKLIICSDFDGPGKLHLEKCRKFLFDTVESMRIVEYLPGLSRIPGEKADITDWMNTGHTVKEFTDYVFESCLDVRNDFQLQEDKEDLTYGIYKTSFEKRDVKTRKQIVNFTIDGINIINRVDTEEEYFEMIIRTKNNQIIKRRGSVLVFNDVRKFRDFLNSSDLVFRGTIDILIDLKEWCFKYKKRETTTAYDVGGIRKINGKWLFVSNKGSFDNDFVYDESCIYYENDKFVDFREIELPTKEELEKIYDSLFGFNRKEITYTVLGYIGASLLNGKYQSLGIKLNHLAFFGEAGAGKSTMVEEIMMPIFNYNIKTNTENATNFGLLKDTSTNTTIPFFADEYKPSQMNVKKCQELSSFFRNAYDKNSSIRGTKNLQTIEITPARPIVIIGEEGFHQNETALIERSNIVYASKATRDEENLKHLNVLIENKEILNKLGKLLIREALLADETKFEKFRRSCEKYTSFKDRVLNTFVNTVQGLFLIRKALKRYGLELDVNEGIECIKKNIDDNVLQNSNEVRTQIEKVFEIIDEMMSNGNNMVDGVRIDRTNELLYIYVPVIYPEIKKYIRDFNRDENILGKNDFIKQLKSSKYLIGDKALPIRINNNVKKCFKLDLNLISELGFDNLCIFSPVSEEDGEQIPF